MPAEMSVNCPQCGSAIAAEDVNLETVLAKCAECDSVFSFRDQVPGAPPTPASAAATEARQLIGRPGGIRVEEDAGGLRMIRTWRSPAVGFMIAFTLFWDGFLVFWYFIAFTQNGPLIMKIFPVMHVAVGLGITWLTLAMLLNKTIVEVGYERVRVRHRPIWWPGNRTLDAASLKRLEVRASDVTRNGRRQWLVMVDTTDDRRFALLSSLPDRDHALYIKQEIERFLDLKSAAS